MKTNEKTSDRKEEARFIERCKKAADEAQLVENQATIYRMLNQDRAMNGSDLLELENKAFKVLDTSKDSLLDDFKYTTTNLDYIINNLERIRNRFSKIMREENEKLIKNEDMLHFLFKEWNMNLGLLNKMVDGKVEWSDGAGTPIQKWINF